MTKQKNCFYLIIILVCFLMMQNSISAQEEERVKVLKNQFSTNLMLPFFGSFDLSYERTIANKWAVGLGGISFGKGFSELNSNNSSFGTTLELKYELNPFIRIYFQGAQNKSHFLELFGSASWVEESGRFVRSNNEEGFGVYNRETRPLTLGGLGIGYGYRFLFLDNKLVLEAQVGFRTNFQTEYIALTGAPVRAGIKVGYRF